MKKFFKFIMYGFVGLIALGVIAAVFGGEDDTTTTSDPEPATVTKETVEKKEEAAEKKETKNDPGISKKEFEQIQSGMTYEEVVSIIGGEGEVLSETGNKGEDLHTVMYQWDGESGFGANANAMFQGGKLNTKSQFGLE